MPLETGGPAWSRRIQPPGAPAFIAFQATPTREVKSEGEA